MQKTKRQYLQQGTTNVSRCFDILTNIELVNVSTEIDGEKMDWSLEVGYQDMKNMKIPMVSLVFTDIKIRLLSHLKDDLVFHDPLLNNYAIPFWDETREREKQESIEKSGKAHMILTGLVLDPKDRNDFVCKEYFYTWQGQTFFVKNGFISQIPFPDVKQEPSFVDKFF